MEPRSTDDLKVLPEGCISNILSLTSPPDACRSSVVSSVFRSAADSDSVWERFLPSDIQQILCSSVPLSLPTFSSKKELFLHLCDNPLLIDNGTKTFMLEKSSGKKSYMIGAKELSIIWGDSPEYWNWRSLSEARFSEVAELLKVRWLEIHGKMKTKMLSPKTNYGAYIVIKFVEGCYGLDRISAVVSLKFLGGGAACSHSVFFDPDGSRKRQHEAVCKRTRELFLRNRDRRGWIGEIFGNRGPTERIEEIVRTRVLKLSSWQQREKQFPRERKDGWLEIEMGDFFNGSEEDEEVEMSLMEVRGDHWKSGLIIQGIELRPKETRLNIE
ncbi:hypothetical protein NE237_012646 [Protea cynaroides]|uniref:F-box domain-containing protein n=1 Tax=Protea cynaroides TaxID=273540 RepID=A0A9Q0JZF1_9MAGN|nr:hypothetical protein NE237_012646 [Protea cynaroides]